MGGAASLKSRSAPVRVVAAGALYRPSAATSALVAAPGKTIRQARDLIGKRVAVDAQNTIAHIALLKWLKAGGVAAGQVSVVELPFAQMLAPLQRGQFDAAWHSRAVPDDGAGSRAPRASPTRWTPSARRSAC